MTNDKDQEQLWQGFIIVLREKARAWRSESDSVWSNQAKDVMRDCARELEAMADNFERADA